MTRLRKPSTEERRIFLKEMRKKINITYSWLQKNGYVMELRHFKSGLRNMCKKYIEADLWSNEK